MNRIGCFGGTFDPVHKGHVALAVAAATLLQLDRLIILPVGNPYYRGRMPIASPQQRNAMLALAFSNEPYFAHAGCKVIIDPREQHRSGATFTIDTVAELKVELQQQSAVQSSLVWIIGSDAFAKLPTWSRYLELFSYVHFAVASRVDNAASNSANMPENTPRPEGSPLAGTTGNFRDVLGAEITKLQVADVAALFNVGTHGGWVNLAVTLPDASSTHAREAAKHGASTSALKDLLAPPVLQYIVDNGLYQ